MKPERITQFEEEVAGLKVRGSSADVERWLRFGAIAGLLGGIVLVLVGAFSVSGTTNDADQRALLATSTMVGLALTIAGTALFVRVSLGKLLRYWLVRLVHENRTETDRVVAAIEGLGRAEALSHISGQGTNSTSSPAAESGSGKGSTSGVQPAKPVAGPASDAEVVATAGDTA